jgi:hypothetical protein
MHPLTGYTSADFCHVFPFTILVYLLSLELFHFIDFTPLARIFKGLTQLHFA